MLISVPFSGESMWPQLRDGDVLWCLPGAPLRLGAIYLLRDEVGLVAHRLVCLYPQALFTGDRSRQLHPAQGQVWAEVLEVERKGLRRRLPSNPVLLAFLAWRARFLALRHRIFLKKIW